MRLPDRRLNICFATCSYRPDIGGVARSSARIAKYLVDEGHNVHMFAPIDGANGDAGMMQSDVEDGINVHRITTPSRFVIPHARELANAIASIDRTARFDIFHGFFLPMAYPCIKLAKMTGRPLIASIRGSDIARGLDHPGRRRVIKHILGEASWVTSVNKDLLERAAELKDISGRSSVIYNSVDAAAFPKWRLTEASCGVVGTLGAFRIVKNIPLLLQAYAGVSIDIRRRLLLVGGFSDGETQAEVEAAIRSNGLEGEVRITGFVSGPEVAEHLLQMRAFVICSRYDGLPNALLEAAAMGIPLVATQVGGMKELLTNGESAMLVAPNNQEELTVAVEMVLRDDSLAANLSKGALRVAKRLQPAREKNAWIVLYRNLLQQ